VRIETPDEDAAWLKAIDWNLRQARADELVECDLFAGLKWPRMEHPDPDPFALDEVRHICAWFRDRRFGFPPLPGSMGIRRLPHPAFHAYVHTLFWTGLRPSEASGLQVRDLDLAEGVLYVRRSYHRYGYHAPKIPNARRRVELFPETVRVLRDLLPLHVTPEMPVFTTTEGQPIEPKTFSDHWCDSLRALGLRVRGLYCTKDTYVSHALQKVGSIEWVEEQTGVSYATLKKHYAKWLPSRGRVELRRFADAVDVEEAEIDVQETTVGTSISVTTGIIEGNQMRGGGLEPPRVLPH
jgi:integrase